MAPEVGGLSRWFGANGSTASAVGRIDPVVESVFKSVDAVLLVPLIESGQNRLAQVRFAVAVGVFGVEYFRGGADQHPFSPDHDPVREIDLLQKDRRLVVASVAVGVLEILDDAARFAAPIDSQRIIAHLDNPEFAVRSPVKGNRIDHERHQTPCPEPNDKVQQRGRLERSHATKSRSAGPVCCNGWFGDVIPLESSPDPLVFLRLSPRVILFARLGAERRRAQHGA